MTHPAALTPYQRRLFLFLGVATFFEGYDNMALAQLLPTLRREMSLDEWQTGLLISFTGLGTVVAYLLVRQADRWGRRRVLAITVAGYTLCSFATGLTSEVISFGILQFFAKVFLIGEWALSMIYAAEEFPAERRGMVIGVITAWASLGAIVCAAVVPILITTPLGWRTVYFVGTVPLVLLAIARRSLRETSRFEALPPEQRAPASLFRIFRTPYVPRVLKLAAIWTLTYVGTTPAVVFFKQYAVEEFEMTEASVGLLISAGAVLSMPLVFSIGRLLDVTGRRYGAIIIYVLGTLGSVGCYTLRGEVLLFIPVTLAIFGSSAVLPVLNAFTTELFPTELRSDAYAWSNNLLGRFGLVLAPIFVGLAAEDYGWSPAVLATCMGPLAALGLILLWMPETKGRELEDTSSLPGPTEAEAAAKPKPF